jgi:hypothetical protein
MVEAFMGEGPWFAAGYTSNGIGSLKQDGIATSDISAAFCALKLIRPGTEEKNSWLAGEKIAVFAGGPALNCNGPSEKIRRGDRCYRPMYASQRRFKSFSALGAWATRTYICATG